jgi:hypothetical protein
MLNVAGFGNMGVRAQRTPQGDRILPFGVPAPAMGAQGSNSGRVGAILDYRDSGKAQGSPKKGRSRHVCYAYPKVHLPSFLTRFLSCLPVLPMLGCGSASGGTTQYVYDMHPAQS